MRTQIPTWSLGCQRGNMLVTCVSEKINNPGPGAGTSTELRIVRHRKPVLGFRLYDGNGGLGEVFPKQKGPHVRHQDED